MGKKSTESGGDENRAVPKFGTFLCSGKKMSYTESKKERRMTNRNRNRGKNKVTDRKVEMKEREEKVLPIISIISVVVSVMALVISIIGLSYSVFYEQKEYEYKREPELEMSWVPVFQKSAESVNLDIGIQEIWVHIVDENNLDEVYLIRADRRVSKLTVEKKDLCIQLATNMKEYFSENSPDLITSTHQYHYQYIVLKNLDGSTRLYLEYVKNNGNMAEFQVVSEIEIYGLKNGHADDPVYEGEKVMAEQYEEITEYLKKYGF